eukprot:m.98127 g.98127  ORF g.98127 m.98127 type:complete len:119 (+) comp36972_c0_seq3:220-576(+)
MVDMKKAQIISWACILSGVPSSPRPPEPSQGFLTTRATLGLSIASFPSVGSSWERMEDKDSVLLCKLEEAVGYSFENRKFLREAVLNRLIYFGNDWSVLEFLCGNVSSHFICFICFRS